ncbi:NAD(P)-binding protein [Trametopsis cervina]|nr:NAD(P)-binding protein [Trametopsis cervina]
MATVSLPDKITARDAYRSRVAQEMHAMLDKYSQGFKAHVPSPGALSTRHQAKDTIFLTGTTGGLASAILAQLCEMPSVERVYAVNRKGREPLFDRQHAILLDRGYDADAIMNSPKVSLLEADLREPHFGLSQELYNEIRDSTTHIIHSAWPVNFTWKLRLFEPTIKGVRHLVDLALASPHHTPPRLIFISSSSVLLNADHTTAIKEEYVDAKISVGVTYGEAKWVAEQLLARAVRTTALLAMTIRVGQISGSRNGAWNPQEWPPSLIRSSIYLGCIPMLPEAVSWIGPDQVATAILEARNASCDLSPLHIAHPCPVPWRTLFEPFGKRYNLQPVSFDTWYRRLVESVQRTQTADKIGTTIAIAPTTNSISHGGVNNLPADKGRREGKGLHIKGASAANPAAKLLQFFGGQNASISEYAQRGELYAEVVGVPQLDVTKTAKFAAQESLSPAKLKPLGTEDVMQWVAYWEKIGFFPREYKL